MIVHATTVAIDGHGILITGAAGAGKSSLALGLMALGAQLVADDRTKIEVSGDGLLASCPDALQGMIEARGLGILTAPHVCRARLQLCVDLDTQEIERLPPRRTKVFLGHPLNLVRVSPHDHFAAALFHYVKYGRRDRD